MNRFLWVSGVAVVLSSGVGWEAIALADRSPSLSRSVAAPASRSSSKSLPPRAQGAVEDDSEMEQVTSVSQLADVRPTDWAFQALQSLVERYGCIVGYPDKSFRGNQSLTRYEFAAGLNACLDRINELIAAGTANLVRKEDLVMLQRLQEQYSAELATLRGRVDTLETRTTTLERQQFSTTTKLSGELITYLADAFGKNAGDVNNADLGYRLRLDFNTSFSGQDRLRVRLQATNLRKFDTAAPFGASPVGRATNDLSDETRFLATPQGQNGQITLNRLQYRFPVGDRLTLYLDANSIDTSIIADPITPFNDQATGSLSNFAQINPIFFPIGNQAGAGGNLVISPSFGLDFGYQAETDAPANSGVGAFSGGFSAFAQLVYNSGPFKLGLMYVRSYSPEFGVDTLAGSNAAKLIGAGPIGANNYGIQFDYRVAKNLELGGWVGLTQARALKGNVQGDADVWNYALNVAFPDLGGKGNLGGLVFGMQPRLAGTSNSALAAAIGLPDGERKDRDVGYHIEVFYRYQLNDNVSITPGFFWLTSPNHDNRNPDVFVGAIRTTFLF